MTSIDAAFGIAQMERVDSMIERRKELNARYVEELGAWECTVPWYQPLVLESNEKREELKKGLEEAGIASRDFFTLLHEQPPLLQTLDTPVAKCLSERGILLPLYAALTDEEQKYVIQNVKRLCQ